MKTHYVPFYPKPYEWEYVGITPPSNGVGGLPNKVYGIILDGFRELGKRNMKGRKMCETSERFRGNNTKNLLNKVNTGTLK